MKVIFGSLLKYKGYDGTCNFMDEKFKYCGKPARYVQISSVLITDTADPDLRWRIQLYCNECAAINNIDRAWETRQND